MKPNLLRFFVIFLAIWGASCLSLSAQTVTKTYTAPSSVSIDGSGNYGTALPGLNFNPADFSNGCALTEARVTITWAKTDGSCTSPGAGNSFHNETSFRIDAPTGNEILAIPGTWSGSASTPSRTTTFFQGAASIPSGLPVSGTFRPNNGNLNNYIGDVPFGNWVLRAGDNAGGDPLCITSYSVRLTVGTDNTAPSISCPSNITVNNTAGQCNRAVTYGAPSASDACSFFGDDFDPGINTPIWQNLSNVSASTSCGSYSGNALYYNGAGTRQAVTIPINTTAGGNIYFYILAGSGAAPCELADAGEDMVLEYSNNGSTWTNIATYDQAAYTSRSLISVAIPAAARTANTQFRWRQVLHSGTGFDNWYIDNVRIDANTVPYKVTSGLASGSAFPVGTSTVTYTAYDAFGNSRSCNFTVRVNDTELPSISCPSNITTNVTSGCSRAVSYSTPSAGDNCSVSSLTRTAGLASGAAFPVGTTTVTYRATDPSGNQRSCSFTVTVNDNINPAISCPANITRNNDPGQCSAAVSYSTPSVSDNCPGATVSRISGPASGATFPVGSTTVTYRGTDASGNTTNCSFSVTVNDNENPAISCPSNITTNVTAGCSRNVSYATPTATDNCTVSSITRTAGPASGSAFPVGTTNVTYRATDNSGNQRTCTFTITVNDNINPAVSCPANITRNNDPGQCSAAVSYSTPSVSDNCPGATVTRIAGPASGSNFSVGSTTVTYRGTDASGNTANCSFTVTVNDNQNPAISCPANITRNNDPGQCSAAVSYSTPSVTDNCPGATVSRIAGPASGGTFPVGSTTVTYRGTDASGNTANCSFSVTVNDNENPAIACPANLTVNNDPGLCAAAVSYSAPGGTDNCPGVTTSRIAGLGSGATFPVGTTTETYRATDAASNTASCSFTITVVDAEDPSIACPANISVNSSPSLCEQTVSYTAPNGTDNCPGVTTSRTAGLASGSAFNVGVNTVTYTATDAAGNTRSCSFTITVNDNEDPFIVCPANISVNNDPGICGAAVSYTAPPGFDNCPGESTTRTAGLGSGATFPVGSTTETYTVTDAAGNTASCSFNITVTDNENPAIACPANITVNNDAGQCSAQVTYSVPGGTDNCPGATTSRTAGLGSGAAFPVGTTTESYTVTDAAGNTAACSFIVRVNDNENPSIACPANITVNNDAGQCAAVVSYSAPGGNDNCPGASTAQTAGLGSGATFPVGTQTETYTVTDAAGNTNACSFSITVVDAENPVIACPANIAVNSAPGQCSRAVSYTAPNGTDNCPGPSTSRTAGLGSGSTFPVGITTETYTVTDASGNTATCSFTITVNDNEDPVITCPANITVNNDPGNCSAVVTYSSPGGTDNCPGASTARTAGLGSGSAFPVGQTTETYTVTDAAGNTASCSFTIRVNDNENPAIACPANITVSNDAGQCAAVVSYATPGGTDNCPGANTALVNGLGSGSTFPVGTTTEGYTVTDAAGNTASCSFTVTVNDNEDPVIACPANMTVSNDAGQCSAVVSYATPGGTDNCPGASTTRTAGLGSGGTFPVGTSTESYLVTDAAGNTAACSFTITVNDNENPTISCPANISVNNDPGNCSAVVSYTAPNGADNCPGANTARTTGLGSGATFPLGSTTETYTVTDAAGNTANCTFTVTVNDNQNPTITCPANISVNNDPGQCSAVVSYTAPNGADNCPGANTSLSSGSGSGSSFAVGVSTETYTVTDAAGNTANCSFTITVTDNEAPNALCNNLTVQLDNNGAASVTAAAVNNNSSDNCGIQSLSLNTSSFNCTQLGPNNVSLTVTDVNGNTSSCVAVITVEDNVAPQAQCQNITLQLPAAGDSTLPALTVGSGSTDNCSISTYSLNRDRFVCSDLGPNTVTLYVTDPSGNIDSCSATIDVVDQTGVTQRMIDIGADTTICNLDTLNLNAGPGFSTYQWSTGASSQAIDVSMPGSYNVLATDSLGCVGQDTFTLTVDTVDNPNIASLGGPAILCLNDTLELTSDPGYAVYQWSTGDTSQNTLTATGGNIFLTVTAPFGCSRTDTFFIDQRNFPDPNPIIDPDGDTINLCDTNQIMLNVRGGYVSYVWNTGDTTQSIVAVPGTYEVTVTNGFGCWNSSGEKVVRQVTPVPPTIQINGDTLCASSGSNFQWYFNGNAIILANSQCYVATVPGNYWVEVNDLYGCPVNSDTLLIVSVPEQVAAGWNVNAFPNPFQESTFISFEAPERSRVVVDVYSLTGVRVKTLMDREVFAGENVKLEFRPENSSAGVYIFRLITESGQTHTGKLIMTR